MPQWRENTLHVRKGVAPGSFLDLLMRTKDRTTGRGFTDVELASQVLLHRRCMPLVSARSSLMMGACFAHHLALHSFLGRAESRRKVITN